MIVTEVYIRTDMSLAHMVNDYVSGTVRDIYRWNLLKQAHPHSIESVHSSKYRHTLGIL